VKLRHINHSGPVFLRQCNYCRRPSNQRLHTDATYSG